MMHRVRLYFALMIAFLMPFWGYAQQDSLHVADSVAQVHDSLRVNVSQKVQVDAFADTLTLDRAERIIDTACKYIGYPYKFGGKGPNRFDCAGFVRFIYRKFGYLLGPSAPSQFPQGRSLEVEDLQTGDLVFFGGRRGSSKSKLIGHVGIVTVVNPNDHSFRFIHASTSRGVIISNSTEPYYAHRYQGACRILPEKIQANPIAEPPADSVPPTDADALQPTDADPQR